MTLVPLGTFLVGVVSLIVGADRAVRGAAGLAAHYGVSPFFVGVTVISVGTSVPEIVTSVTGAFYGAGALVVGNVVGSETAQITVAVGVVALIAPFETSRRNVAVYGTAVVLAMIVMTLTLSDGRIGRSEGLLMMLAYTQFVYTLYANEGGAEIAPEVTDEPESATSPLPAILVGLLAVVIGGQLVVTGGLAVADALGVPTYLVGLVTGLATTLPEIVVGGLAARRGRGGISVGAILGSNVTDPVFSLGVGAVAFDVVVDPAALRPSIAYMFLVTLAVLAAFYWRRGIDRPVAVACLAAYVPSLLLA